MKVMVISRRKSLGYLAATLVGFFSFGDRISSPSAWASTAPDDDDVKNFLKNSNMLTKTKEYLDKLVAKGSSQSKNLVKQNQLKKDYLKRIEDAYVKHIRQSIPAAELSEINKFLASEAGKRFVSGQERYSEVLRPIVGEFLTQLNKLKD